MLWLAIRFIRLPLEVLASDPESPPSLICEQHRVIQLSDSVQALGIRIGDKAASARARCKDLNVQVRAPETETQRLQTLAEQLLFITPHVSLCAPDGLLLEIGRSLTLFQGLEPLLDLLQQTLQSSGHRYHAGLGHTPLAALILCRQHDDLLSLISYTPDSPRYQQTLSQQTLASLPLPDKLRTALQAPGFRTLADLQNLPAGALGKRHGNLLLDWLARLWGDKPDPRADIAPPIRFRAEMEFSDPVEHCQGLLFPAQRLLSQLEYFLRQRQQNTRALRWWLIDQHQAHRLIIRRATAGADVSLWLDLTRRRFEQVQLDSGILKLVLECARPGTSQAQSDQLFSDPHARPDASHLLDRLQALPRLHLSWLQEQDDFLPENTQKMIPTGRYRKQRANPTPDIATEDRLQKPEPLWLLDTPCRLQQRQQTLLWRGAPLEILPGEYRLSLEWWQQLTRRRYAIARHPRGLCCWIFFDEQAQHWYLHGFF